MIDCLKRARVLPIVVFNVTALMSFSSAMFFGKALAQDAATSANEAQDELQTATDAADLGVSSDTLFAAIQTMITNFVALLPRLLLGTVVFALFFFVARFVKSFIRRSAGGGVGKALGRLAQLGVLLGGLLVAMVIAFPSVKPATVLSGLGVGGVAIGFAFKDILQNYFAGVLLLWREPFAIGDQIETSNGYVGTVQAVETRATTLRTYDGRRIVIPNSNLFTDSVIVNTAREVRRTQYDVGIGYADDIEEARSVMLNAVKSTEGVKQDPAPDVLVVELAGSSVNLRARWWSAPERSEVITTQDRVLTAIKYALDEAAIDMPYPTQVTLFHDQTEATDGDRSEQREGWPAGDAPPQPRYKVEAD